MFNKVTQAVEAIWTLRDRRYRAFWPMRWVTSVPRRRKIAAQRAAKLPRPEWKPSEDVIEKAKILEGMALFSRPSRFQPNGLPICGRIFPVSLALIPIANCRPSSVPITRRRASCCVFRYGCHHSCAACARDRHSQLLVETVAEEMGCKPTISYMTAWWSIPAHNEAAQHAEKYHRDVEDFDFTKLLVYLTDVDEEAGPHVFVKGSHLIEKLTSIRRYADEEVFAAFGKENEVRFTGSAGTCFLEKTYGMHRGVPPVSRPRLTFQVLYSLRDTIYGPPSPIMTRARADCTLIVS